MELKPKRELTDVTEQSGSKAGTSFKILFAKVSLAPVESLNQLL